MGWPGLSARCVTNLQLAVALSDFLRHFLHKVSLSSGALMQSLRLLKLAFCKHRRLPRWKEQVLHCGQAAGTPCCFKVCVLLTLNCHFSLSLTGKLCILYKATKGSKGEPFMREAERVCVCVSVSKCYFYNVLERKINENLSVYVFFMCEIHHSPLYCQ